MPKLISKITKKQESQIPHYIKKWVDLASNLINREKIKEIFKKIYKEDKIIIIGESFQNMIDLIRMVTENKKLEYDSQLGSQLHSQLGSQLHSQVYSQLGSQLRSQLHSQLRSQLRSQLDSQLGSQLHSQLYSQLYSQLHSQLRSQLGLQLDSQLRSQLGSQVYSQLHSQLYSQNIKYFSYISYYLYDWAGYYDYAESIGVEFSKDSLKEYFNILLNIPIIIFIGNVVFVCEKPQCLWEIGRLHSEMKPAISWKDDTGFYYLNGVNFKKDLWEKIVKKTISSEEALKLTSTEQRIIAIKYLGGEKLMKELGGEVIFKDKYGELIKLSIKDSVGDNYVYLKCLDPSKNLYVYLRVPPTIKTPRGAEAWTYFLDEFKLDYLPLIRT